MGSSVMADAAKATTRLSVTWPKPRPPVVREKNIFHSFCYTKPLDDHHSYVKWFAMFCKEMYEKLTCTG